MGITVPYKLGIAVYTQEDRQGEEQLDSLQSQLQMLKEKGKRWVSITRVYVDICPVSRQEPTLGYDGEIESGNQARLRRGCPPFHFHSNRD